MEGGNITSVASGNLQTSLAARLRRRMAGDAPRLLNTLYFGLATAFLIAGCRIGSSGLQPASPPVHVQRLHISPSVLRLYHAQCRHKPDLPADMAPCVDEIVNLTAVHATGNPPGVVPWAMAQLSDGTGMIRFRISDPSVLTSLQSGNSLIAEVWRDRITAIETYTRTVVTDDSPAYVPPRPSPPPPWYDVLLNPDLVLGMVVGLPGLILLLLPLIWFGGGRAQTKRQTIVLFAIYGVRCAVNAFGQAHPL